MDEIFWIIYKFPTKHIGSYMEIMMYAIIINLKKKGAS
jgi:hypothetical protein